MFVDVSVSIGNNPPRMHSGVAAADLDGDGRGEFIVGGFGAANRHLRAIGGQLRDVASPLLADADGFTVSLAAGDIDGDGRDELYVVNEGADRLLKSRLDGSWEDVFERLSAGQIPNRSAGRGVAAIDRRGVGRYGFFVAGDGGPMRLYELGPAGALADLAGPLGLAHAAAGRGVLTAPIFSHSTDIVCVNEEGPNLAFRNRGDGVFDDCALDRGLADTGERGWGVTAFDAGEGELGLSWVNRDGPHRLMVRGEDEAWRDRATAALAMPSAARTVIAADFDNDGHDELVFINLGEPNRLFRVSANTDAGGDVVITMLDPGDARDPEGFGTGAAVCDVDGDGVLELLVARGEREPQPLGLFRARAAERNNWLRVRPLTRFGAPARGALVRAEAGGRVRVKCISGGSGYCCQNEPVAHFGFGPERRPERVRVTWPDGAGVVLLNPGVNRTVTVPYPRG
jgi:ASPIC/UnbV protein/VCBS repeat protein